MKVTVSANWTDVGEVVLDDGRLSFPAVPDGPGVYRFRLVGSAGAASSYVGEALRLRRRHYGYRLGYARQPTNARMNARMKDHLTQGGRIFASVATEATINVDDGPTRSLDLSVKRSRLPVESAALHALPEAEPIENRPGVGEQE